MKKYVSPTWGPWAFLVNPSNGTRRIIILDCEIPRGEFPTEQQIRDHMKYFDIPPRSWCAFPITTWHSGGPGPVVPTIYPVGSPVLFTTAWAVDEAFYNSHAVGTQLTLVDLLKEYVHTAKHVDIFGRAPTEELRLAYVDKLLDMGINGVAGFGGGAWNAQKTRIITAVWHLSRRNNKPQYTEERSSRTEAEVQATSPPFADWLQTLQMLEQELSGKPVGSPGAPVADMARHPLFQSHPDLLEDLQDAVQYAGATKSIDILDRLTRLAVDTRGKPLPQWPEHVKFSGSEPFRLALWFCAGGVCKGYTLRCTQPYPPVNHRLPIVIYTETSMIMESVKKIEGPDRRWSWIRPPKGTATEETRGAEVQKTLIDIGVRIGVTVCSPRAFVLSFETFSKLSKLFRNFLFPPSPPHSPTADATSILTDEVHERTPHGQCHQGRLERQSPCVHAVQTDCAWTNLRRDLRRKGCQ